MTEKITKLAHIEGHTSLCFDDDGRHIATCGFDGNLRIWELPIEDSLTTQQIGKKAFAVHVRKCHLYVSNDCNGIPAMSFPFLEPEGYLSFFSAPVTHIVSNKNGSIVCAGSCDFTIRVINVKDRKYNVLKHEAPILSLALDPKEKFLVSSSCDGSVCVWELSNNAKVKEWKGILQKSNAFENSDILCRISWEPTSGKYLAIPTDKNISVYDRENWDLVCVLEDNRITSKISVSVFSPCGTYLAGGCLKGILVVWNVTDKKCVAFNEQDKKADITGIEWNPNGNGQLAFCNTEGYFTIMEDVIPTENKLLTEDEILASFADFENDESEDENSFSISKIKAETVGLNENSNDTVQLNKKQEVTDNREFEDDNSLDGNASKIPTIVDDDDDFSNHKFTSIPRISHQAAFQPGSTPIHLDHRFMVWNSVGLIINHNTDDENTIDIEFHDTSIHHSLHINNNNNYTMATMSTNAVLFASRSEEEISSTLLCMNIGSWDTMKEWSIGMTDKEEEIEAIALGESWVAAATNQRLLRLFTIGGVQLEVISIPGPVVCMAGHEDQLLLAYHQGAGLPGEQSLSLMVIYGITSNLCSMNYPLPLGPQATLSWLGYTDEGTPISVDSNGYLKMLSRSSGSAWFQICNTKSQVLTEKVTIFFVVGLSESQHVIRGIICKGSKFPATLPRPVVTVTSLKIPLCEQNTEKGQLEETIIRHRYLNNTLANLEKNNYEINQETKESTLKTIEESLIKAFALACRTDREFRATEICELMNSSYSIQLAIRYATMQKHLQLAQRLSEMAHQKLEEETNKQRNEVFEQTNFGNEGERRPRNTSNSVNSARDNEETDSMDIVSDLSQEMEFNDENEIDCTPEIENATVLTPGTTKKNPFKKSTNSKESIEIGKGFDRVDKLTPNERKSSKMNEKNSITSSKQSMLFQSKSKDSKISSQKKKKKSTDELKFDVWFKSAQTELQAERPDLDDDSLRELAKKRFDELTKSELQKLDAVIASEENSSRNKKRKKNSMENEESLQNGVSKSKSAKKLSSSTCTKLSNFSFFKKVD